MPYERVPRYIGYILVALAYAGYAWLYRYASQKWLRAWEPRQQVGAGCLGAAYTVLAMILVSIVGQHLPAALRSWVFFLIIVPIGISWLFFNMVWMRGMARRFGGRS